MARRSNPFTPEGELPYGQALPLSPFVRRLTAANPGPLTGPGSNVYIIGRGEVGVIDPGPDDDGHFETLMAALKGERVSHILLTHAHRDHCGCAMRLRRETGAVLCAHSPVKTPRGTFRPGEGGRLFDEFVCNGLEIDMALEDGERIAGMGWELFAIHTPGHAPDHLCFFDETTGTLFSADLVVPGSSVVIPASRGGSLAQYLASTAYELPHARLLPMRVSPSGMRTGARRRKPKVLSSIVFAHWSPQSGNCI